MTQRITSFMRRQWVAAVLLLCCGIARAQDPAQTGTVSGVVKDPTGATVAGAHVSLTTHTAAEREAVTDATGAFRFTDVETGTFALVVSATGLATESTSGVLQAGEQYEVPALELRVATAIQSVDAMSREQIAEIEVKQEEQQRVLGVIPNFFVSYDWNAAPLTAKQKFELGWHATLDPTRFVFATIPAGIEQAENTYPGFGGGWSGYGERYGAILATSTTSTLLRGSIMPAIFHQDPRYFYKGTGTVPARAFYALSTAVRARGDNGHWQLSSGILADFAAGAISNFYYAPSDRHGADLTLESGALSVVGVGVGHILQEFLWGHFTSRHAHGVPSPPPAPAPAQQPVIAPAKPVAASPKTP